MATKPRDLSFESVAQHVAKRLQEQGADAAVDAAVAFERNLGWDCRKLLDRAEQIKASAL